MSAVAFHLAARGNQVHVIASRGGYRNRLSLPPAETVAGVSVHRIGTPSFGLGGLIGRSMKYAAFHIGATIRTLALARPGDIVIAKSDPPLICLPMSWSAARRQALFVNWLQDLYPETAFALGIGSSRGLLGRTLLAMRNTALRRADACVAIGESMADKLRRIDIGEAAIRVIANFCDDETVRPIAFGQSSLLGEFGIDSDAFVVGYSGNLGRAHDVDTMLSAATALRARDDIVFLFTGGGHLRDILKDRRDELGLTNIVCLPYQPLEKLSDTLAAADIHWLSLRPELEGYILPSKLHAAAAAGRGVIAIGDPDGEAARIVEDNGFGHAVAIGDSEALVAHILALSEDRERCAALGAAARRFIEQKGSRSHALAKWEDFVASLAPDIDPEGH